jgi:hypothetical protein
MEKLNTDCLVLIFNELQADSKLLYLCLLVKSGVIWWFLSYNIILSCLPTSSKQLLFDNDIKLPLTILSKPPIFNYVSHYKFLRAYTIDNIIDFEFKAENLKEFNYLSKRNLLEQEVYKLIISQCKNIKELAWETSQPLSSFSRALTCFSQLHSLYIDLYYVNSNNLNEMAQICKN